MSDAKKNDVEKILSHEFLEELKKVRKQKKISLEEIAECTNIKKEYIQAIEEGDLSKLPGGIYNKAYIRSVSEYLGINTKPFEKEVNPEEAAEQEKVKISIGPSKDSMLPGRTILLICLLLTLALYSILIPSTNNVVEKKPSTIQQATQEMAEEEFLISILALEDTEIIIIPVQGEEQAEGEESDRKQADKITKILKKNDMFSIVGDISYTLKAENIDAIEVYLNGLFIKNMKKLDEEQAYDLSIESLFEGMEDYANDKEEEDPQS
jgi:cytoskeletal protein RodZ